MKPMLASDWQDAKVKFPVLMQPKIDGVRGLHLKNGLTGRSLKRHANLHVTHLFSAPCYLGLDGELAAARETDPALCRTTTSALTTIQGAPFVLWWVFDYITASTIGLPYLERYKALERFYRDNPHLEHLRLVPYRTVNSLAQMESVDAEYLDAGYEGSILRDPKGMYKEGRSTVTEGGLLRIKRFVEEDAVVHSIQEGQRNENEAEENELGYTFRSTHQANMSPNGMVGALLCNDVKTGQAITVSAGSMSHDLRSYYFRNQQDIIGKTIKYKFFPKGIKDKPRFPTFQSIRSDSDIVGN